MGQTAMHFDKNLQKQVSLIMAKKVTKKVTKKRVKEKR